MTITTTLTATLTEAEHTNWLKAYWGCYTREDNIKVAKTIIAMLTEGIPLTLLNDDYKFIEEVGRRSGADEVTDTEARYEICLRMSILLKATEIPTFSPDTLSEDAYEVGV